jgi:hypothetical protein
MPFLNLKLAQLVVDVATKVKSVPKSQPQIASEKMKIFSDFFNQIKS